MARANLGLRGFIEITFANRFAGCRLAPCLETLKIAEAIAFVTRRDFAIGGSDVAIKWNHPLARGEKGQVN